MTKQIQLTKEGLEALSKELTELTEIKRPQLVERLSHARSEGLGAKVSVKFNGSKTIYQLVGEWEADPVKSKISIDSPLGIALLNKKKGDKVEVEAPAGKVVYEILSIN